jgi:hypothetical protein
MKQLKAIPDNKKNLDESQENAFVSGPRQNLKAIGSSGTKLYGGYFNEEYLQKLRGRAGAKIYDEMRRSEPQISMLTKAIMNTLKAALWDIQEAKDVPGSEEHKEFINYLVKEKFDWPTHLHEALTFIVYGFSAFEEIHNVVIDDPKFGSYNGLKCLAFRDQKSIERWNVDRVTGELKSITQFVQGDLANKGSTMIDIPAENLLILTLQKEGDNYEGISDLRPLYGPWFRKNTYLKLAAIGVEKSAIGTPHGVIPTGKENSDDKDRFEEVLQDLATHESSYIMTPEGWKIDVYKTEFDPSKIKELILLENSEMVNALVANFLLLGTGGNSGAFSLSMDLSDFFLNGLQNYAEIICQGWNRKVIPNLINLNYGPQPSYPKLAASGIKDKAGKELAEVVQILLNSRAIRPDMKLEEFLRKQFNLPAVDEATIREIVNQIQNPGVDPAQPDDKNKKMAERKLAMLSEKYNKFWDKNKGQVKEVMQDNLKALLDGHLKQIRSKWKSASVGSRATIVQKLEMKGLNEYRANLKEALAEVANGSLDSARKQTKWVKKKVELADSIQLSKPRGGYYNALPLLIQKMVLAQTNLIVDTQAADIAKIVAFQYHSSQASSDDIDQIILDIESAVKPAIDGSTSKGISIDAAAGNAVSQVHNQAQMEWFFVPEVLETIESFTYMNESPESAICQELTGTTWAVGDSDLDRYSPPLHHNCKSYLSANEKGASGNPEINNGTPISQKALDSISLAEIEKFKQCDCNYHLCEKK